MNIPRTKVLGYLISGLVVIYSSMALSEQLTQQAQPVKLFKVEQAEHQAIRSFFAEVKAHTRTELAFRVSGELAEIKVKEGQKVNKNELLARLDPVDFDIALQRAKAEYTLAQQQFERAKLMIDKKLIADADYDQAAANLQVKSASLMQARLNRQYADMRAPFAGTISNRLIENFNNIQAKQTVLILQSNKLVDVKFQLPESLMSLQLKPDALDYQAQVHIDAYPNQTFYAQYREHSTEADQKTGAYTVTLSMPYPDDEKILPGMTAMVKVDLNQIFEVEHTSFYVPAAAVFKSDSDGLNSRFQQVWRYNPETKTVSKVDVVVGELTSAGLEIVSGLKDGDMIVAAGINYLREGLAVRPMQREQGL